MKGKETQKEYATFAVEWTRGQPVPYLFLARVFSKVESLTGRIEITKVLSDAFRAIICTTPGDLLPCIYLCVNKLGPAHEVHDE